MKTIALSDDAYRVLCGLVQHEDDVDAESVTALADTWTELRAAFRLSDYKEEGDAS